MSTITATQDSSAANSARLAGATTRNGAEEAQDKFLKLLVTQLNNQDPLNPMDNAQLTTQMAQIQTVTGVDKLNTTMLSIASSLNAAQSLQASSMIGHDVLVPGKTLWLADGGANAGVELAQGVDALTVSIKDASGNLVHQVELGAQPQGIVAIHWDGVSDSGVASLAGKYSFEVSAKLGDQPVEVQPLSQSRVLGVNPRTDGAQLLLDRAGTAAWSDVRQVM